MSPEHVNPGTSIDSIHSSSSNMSITVTLGVPMPTPGMPGTPKFKGRHVSDFLDALEQHADSARVPHSLLPGYVLRYCHAKVQMVIGVSSLLSGDDWVETRVYLTNLYGKNNALYYPFLQVQYCSCFIRFIYICGAQKY